MLTGTLPKVVVAVLVLNIVAAAAFFGLHTVREHRAERAPKVWAVTTGTKMLGFAPVDGERDPSRTFWEETLMASSLALVNALVLAGYLLLRARH